MTRLRYTLHLLQPDGSYLAHAHGDGPGDDLDTPAIPDPITGALRVLYGDGWRLSGLWGGGWRVLVNEPKRGDVNAGYIDYGDVPPEPDPAQVVLFGVGS